MCSFARRLVLLIDYGKDIMPPEEITYVELSLPREHHSVRRKEPPTEYANIDLHSHLHLQTIGAEREEEEELGNNSCETPLMSSRRESAV